MSARQSDTPLSQSVLGFFESNTGQQIDTFLENLRPAPLDAAGRAQVLASLPKVGAVTPSTEEGKKIAAVDRLLGYCGRDGMITFKVIELNHPFIGLYRRTVIVVSRPLLNLVDMEEFVALVAHELGHEFDWDEYWTAMQQHDHRRMQQLELRSDGFAVLTLLRLRVDPERLVSAVQRVTRYNQRRNITASAEDYVSLKERVSFLRAVARLPWAPIGRATDIVVDPGPDNVQERAALMAAVALLPMAPARIAVMDVTQARPGVREHLLTLDAFTVKGNGVIYVVQQSALLGRARTGSAVARAMLAVVLWHEMAHLSGAEERAARLAEEELWTRFIRDGLTDQVTGLRYLQALKRRPDDQLLVAMLGDAR